MAFAWKYLIPITIAHTTLVAAEVTAMGALALPGVIELGVVAAVNLAFTVWVMRRWARFLGYRPETERVMQPKLTTQVGGLQAAERMRASS